MAVIAAGQPAPEFSLARARRASRSRAPTSRAGGRCWSSIRSRSRSVCTDQLSIYNELLDDFAQHGADALRRVVRRRASQEAFKRAARRRHRAALGLRAQGRRLPRVRRPAPRRLPAARARADRPRRASSSGATRPTSPGDLPGANLIFDALDARAGLSGLGSAPLPPVGPGDHVRGPEAARLVVVYADFECPFCAALEVRLRELPLRVGFRHFPVRSSHPRAWPAAARRRGGGGCRARFWAMHDALFADQGRLEDPHLWERAERLGLDVARFDADRRSAAVEAADRRATSAPACAPGWPRRRRCSPTASATPAARSRGCSSALANPD